MTKLIRRRFLQVSAASAGVTGLRYARPPRHQWQFRALGADAALVLYADHDEAQAIRSAITKKIAQIENSLSLYRSDSLLSQLNREGRVEPDDAMSQVFAHAQQIHRESFGAFDPAIGSIWSALARGATPPTKLTTIEDTIINPNRIVLNDHAQQVTFNGIAQGYLTDEIFALLNQFDVKKKLVNMGEYRGDGKNWSIAIENARANAADPITLNNRSIATSAADAMSLGPNDIPHILSRDRRALWRAVSVEAETAVIADGFSTAFTLMSRAEIEMVKRQRTDITRVWLRDWDNKLLRLT